jgi:predicted DNA binding CopG/RHH family protein
MSKLKKIPSFKNEAEERAFWEENDSSDYLDWSTAKKVTFENLKPSTKTISLRLPENLLNDLKGMANQLDIPYQSLMKILLSDATKKRITSGEKKSGIKRFRSAEAFHGVKRKRTAKAEK